MARVINHLYQFEDFRLDPAKRLLFKNGDAVPLTPKAFDTLLALVISDGRVVEKDELMREVWGGTVVEEVGLAKNISALRKALGESPDEHRYIVTVPGRGYRFVAAVTTVKDGQDAEAETAAEPPSATSDAPGPSSPVGPRRRTALLVAAGVLILTITGGGLYFRSRTILTSKDTILLIDFVNQTGQPVFDRALKQGLAVQLEQSPFLNIFPDARVQQTLRLMGRSPDERVTRDLGAEICRREGIKAMIAGSIVALGRHYVLALDAIDGRNGETLARTQDEAASKEDVLHVLSQAAARLRGRLGESIASIKQFGALLEVTTPSLDALQAYSLGMEQRRKGNPAAALSFYKQAVELDPQFASAYGAMAALYGNAREPRLAAEYAAKAYALKSRVSEREQLRVSSLYCKYVTGDLDKEIDILEMYRRLYPGDLLPYNNVSTAYAATGQLAKAVEAASQAMSLDPSSSSRYATLGSYLLRLNRLAESSQVYERAVSAKLDDASVHRGLYRIAFVRGDAAAIARELDWAARGPNDYNSLLWQFEGEQYFGRLGKSRETVGRAIARITGTDAAEIGASYAADTALAAAAAGECRAAIEWANRSVSIERNRLSLSRAALALAQCRESAGVPSIIGELAKEYPEDTLTAGLWLPVIRAASELGRDNPQLAIDLLAPARRFEAAAEFWPQYLRGQALLRLRNSAEAQVEFTRILDNRGQAATSPLYPLALLGAARAWVIRGDIPQARKSYQDFLALWKDADSDLPVRIAAQKEYEALP